jgi:drug/metabolite transporter (DMT)-like permease
MKERFPRTAREWGYTALLSLLMISISNGCSTTAIKHIPSNEAALLTASLALWMSALGAIGPQGHELSMRSIIGLLLGLAGVALLVWPRDAAPSGHLA